MPPIFIVNGQECRRHNPNMPEANRYTGEPVCLRRIGKRDYAIVAVLLGFGIRRAELAAAQVQDVQQREDRWVFGDLIGKGGHIRTVSIPDWVDEARLFWMTEACLTAGAVFRPINKAGGMGHDGFSPKVIWGGVKQASAASGWRTSRLTIFGALARAYVTSRAENSSRSNFCWAT